VRRRKSTNPVGVSNSSWAVQSRIELWEQGRFPFDRLIEDFPLTEINDAEQASLTGRVIKPVLLPSAH
jgi:aryl-alcohol dehydrogenase